MRIIALVLLALVPAAPAAAHVGRPVLPDAVQALQAGSIYVDYDAKPSITRLEADRVRSSLPPDVRVAVLPRSVTREVGTDPAGVAAALATNVGRRGAYLVVVGGELSTVDAAPAAKAAFDSHRAEGLGPAVEAAAAEAATARRGGSNWPAFVVSILLGLVALGVLAWRSRQRVRPAGRSG